MLTTRDLDAVCSLVKDLCGIYLDENKSYLIEGRLARLLETHGCSSYYDLVVKARGSMGQQVAGEIIDAITTNETLWFRDRAPFEALRYKVLPEIIDAKLNSGRGKQLRIWSAACSTGQEPYSLAMTIADTLIDIRNWNIEIYGTDISTAALAKAKAGLYGEMEISRGLDQVHLSGFFEKQGTQWKICDSIRRMCRFDHRNLLQPFNHLGTFDIIFCRNVAIYFPEPTQRDLFTRLAQVLTPEGWLFAGSSEILSDIGRNWVPQQHCRAACYRPNMPPVAHAR